MIPSGYGRAGAGGSGAGKSQGAFQLGTYEGAVRARLAHLAQGRTSQRIWAADHTVWSAEPVPELTDRLGWLGLPETMPAETEEITSFAGRVRREGYKHAVLLGMGGSSLAAGVYQAAFGNREGFPALLVLDSTHPDAVRSVEQRIDPSTTLFIVASKSGTTIETLSFFKYFFNNLSAGTQTPGAHFAAITDPGTPLVDLAAQHNFRKVFEAFPDLGGRYSALSHFGLVPAALIGMDIAAYLARAGLMADRCRSPGEGGTNPGMVLGAALGELALAGRDKITFVTSPALAAFPTWLEQLIAESTGKNAKGIVPVAGEPLGSAEVYREDRVFAYVSLREESEPETDRRLDELASRGHPILRFEMDDMADLAAEMFRWEMGVAVAGAVLGIHPFNQPDVQKAKSLAKQAMEAAAGTAMDVADTVAYDDRDRLRRALRDKLGGAKAGDYLCLQAYIAPTPHIESIFDAVRTSVRSRHGIATTAGFGPRFLHSTGQLHKGGPDTGIFIQMVDHPREDVEIPQSRFTFGRLISAQALGDYRALVGEGRRLVRLQLGTDPLRALTSLRKTLDRAE